MTRKLKEVACIYLHVGVFSGCQESYDDSESCYACLVGCKSQNPIPSPETYLEVTVNHY